MSGIAFIIPGADFSSSPLGTVNFKKTVSEIVNDYATKIGSEEYNLPLSQMLYSLNDLGVLDNLDIYPAIGDTLAKQKINLMSREIIAETEWQGRNLVFGANAGINSDGNGIQLDANVDIGEIDNHDIEVDLSKYPFLYADVRFGTRTGQIYTSRPTTIVLVDIYNECARFVSGGRVFLTNVNIYNSRVRFACSNDKTEQNIYINETKYSNIATATINTMTMTDAIGPKTGSVVSANIRFFAKGLVPKAKVESVNTIFKTFLDSVKPNE